MDRIANMKIDWREVVKRWDEGNPVWSVGLGGIGPNYEQCIQVLVFEIMSRWEGPFEFPKLKSDDKKFPKAYSDHADKVTKELDKDLGFSGAQVGMARITAWQFMFYGYEYMMKKAPEERRIQVSKDFPEWKKEKIG